MVSFFIDMKEEKSKKKSYAFCFPQNNNNIVTYIKLFEIQKFIDTCLLYRVGWQKNICMRWHKKTQGRVRLSI